VSPTATAARPPSGAFLGIGFAATIAQLDEQAAPADFSSFCPYRVDKLDSETHNGYMESTATTNARTSKGDSMNYFKDTIDIADLDALSRRGATSGFTLEFSSCSPWVDIIKFDRGTGTGLAIGARTGQWFAFVIKDDTVRRQMLRVTISPLIDVSIADGTLTADPDRRFSGSINHKVTAKSM
jgi:hypothetical protein